MCVLQTALGLLDAGRRVFLVRDAVGSRRAESKETAIGRLERHGAEIVTTEMVIFEWLERVEHPRFREVLAIVKAEQTSGARATKPNWDDFFAKAPRVSDDFMPDRE